MHFFDGIPEHIMTYGVVAEAGSTPLWTTMKVEDTFDDGKGLNGGPTNILTFTGRAFNIFEDHAGSKSGNQFGDTGIDVRGDNLMVVVRHEVAHQFDRVRDGDTTLRARYDHIRNSATKDEDWLRTNVGDDTFRESPQEIQASQMGNQFLLSGSAQLRVAMERFANGVSTHPMMWFIYHLDFFAFKDSPTDANTALSSWIYDREDEVGKTQKFSVTLTRDSFGRLTSFQIPTCGVVTVTYATDDLTSFVNSVTPASLPDCDLTTGGIQDETTEYPVVYAFGLADPASENSSNSEKAITISLIIVCVLLFLVLALFAYRELGARKEFEALRAESADHPAIDLATVRTGGDDTLRAIEAMESENKTFHVSIKEANVGDSFRIANAVKEGMTDV